MLDGLAPVYDLFVRLFLWEVKFKCEPIARAHIAPGYRVLPLGGPIPIFWPPWALR